jgi:hypothetical protein
VPDRKQKFLRRFIALRRVWMLSNIRTSAS